MYQQDYQPEFENTDTACLGIYLIKAEARFPSSLPSTTIIAHSEEEAVDISFLEGITRIKEVRLVGYALPKYTCAEVLYVNNGEYLHEHINN